LRYYSNVENYKPRALSEFFCRPKDISVLPNVTESLKVFSICAIPCEQMALPISITGSLLLLNSFYVSVVYRFRIIVNISIVMLSRDSEYNPCVESLLSMW